MKKTLSQKKISGRLGVISVVTAIALFIVLPLFLKPVRSEARDLMVLPADVSRELNNVRKSYGLESLGHCDALTECAKVRAQESSVLFEHERPDGRAWYSVNPRVQYGENLLWTSLNRNAKQIVELWMNSPTHRALILDGNYRTMGVASYTDADGVDYWVVEFGY